jgi:hypothetical protein
MQYFNNKILKLVMEGIMDEVTITTEDKKLAESCLECPICKRARKKQKGFAYWFVKNIEDKFCPNCKAYFKVYGRKAHEPIPKDN